MSGEPKTLTPERFRHRHPVEAIRFTGANASDIYKFVGWEVSGDRVRLDNKAGEIRLWSLPIIRAGDWVVRRPQPLHKSEAACRPNRYVVYSDVDFHATFEPEGVPVVARDEMSTTEAMTVASYLALRDEAAALRAAAQAYLAALDEYRGQEPAASAMPYVESAYFLNEAEAVLRRLAGGESEK